MQKEILAHLIDNETDSFKTGLIALINNYTHVEQLSAYSFLPSMLDSWLLSAEENLNFKLHKLFQPGKLVYDITTYIIVPNKGNEAFIITLNNAYHRDSEARNEIIKRKGTALNKRLSLNTFYDGIFDDYIGLLSRKFSGVEVERSAKAAWILAQDKTHQAMDRLVNEKNIKYVGIANLKGVIEVEIGTQFHKIFKNIRDEVSIPSLVNEIKVALQLKADMFAYKTLQTIRLVSEPSANQPVIEPNSNQNFKKKLQLIIGQYQDTATSPKLDLVKLQAAVIGYLCARRNEYRILSKPVRPVEDGGNNLMILPKNVAKNDRVQMVTLKVPDTLMTKAEIEKEFQAINIRQHKYIFDHYNILRIEQIFIMATKSKLEVMVVKKVATIPLPEKNKRSFTQLIAQGSFDAFEYNLNLFLQSILTISQIDVRHPEFMPSFFLGLFLEGVLQEKINLYVQKMTYANYGFLIESVEKNQLVLFTNAKSDPDIANILSKFDKQIFLLAEKRKIYELNLLQFRIIGREISVVVSTQNILPLTQFASKEAQRFKKNDLGSQQPFAHLVKNLIYKVDSPTYTKALNAPIKQFLLVNQQKIFPGQIAGEGYVPGGVIGFIAASWVNLLALELDNRDSYGHFYLSVTPKQAGSKRKLAEEVFPQSLAFIFKWDKKADRQALQALADDLINHPFAENSRRAAGHVLYRRKAKSVIIVSSETEVVTRVNTLKIEDNLYEMDDSPAIKKCRRVRASTTPGCANVNSIENQEIKKALKEIINLPDAEIYFSKVKNELHNALREQGIDEFLLNTFEKKVSDHYATFGDIYLDNHYKYLTGDSEKNFLQQHKSQINLKLNQWVSLVAFYNLFDGLIGFRQVDSILPRVFISADLFETINYFLAQRFLDYGRTQPLGRFFQTLASNPIAHGVSFVGTVVQFSYGSYLITSGQVQAFSYYWTFRGLHQFLAYFSKTLVRAHFPMFYMDILASMLSHIHSSRTAISNYARFFPLSSWQQLEIGFKFFFAIDLSRYDREIAFKNQLTALYEYLKNSLNETQFRAVVFYADTMVKRQLFLASTTEISGLLQTTRTVKRFELKLLSHHLIEGSNRLDAKVDLSNISTENYLPTHESYLGSPSDTKDCINYYSKLCINSYRKSSEQLHSYHLGYSLQGIMDLKCLLINGASPNGSDCERHKQVLHDQNTRSIRVIDGADQVLPTQLRTEGNFAWISIPRKFGYSHRHCGFTSNTKQCNGTYIFNNNHPFILVDKTKPVHNPNLYLNAPQQIIGGAKTTRLQAAFNNPAVVYVKGQKVAYNGSKHYSTVFILEEGQGIHGYLRGGNTNDSLVTSNYTNDLRLAFNDEATASSNNQTLEVINIESYLGTKKGREKMIFNTCQQLIIDAQGSDGAGDSFTFNDSLRCKKNDLQRHRAYGGDTYYLPRYKSLIIELLPNASQVDKPVVLIRPNVSIIFSHTTKIQVPFLNLRFYGIKTVSKRFPGPAYAMVTNQGNILLKSNVYARLNYITQENFNFLLKPRTLNEFLQSIVLHTLYRNLQPPSLKPLDRLINSQALEDINIVVSVDNPKNYSRAYLISNMVEIAKQFIWQLQRFTIDNTPLEILEIGSIYSDQFSTGTAAVSYTFIGGEGADIYKILPSESNTTDTEYVLIDNKAFLYNEYHGQDIVDLSAFEYLSLQLSLQEINAYEKAHFGLDELTIVLMGEYDNLGTQGSNRFRLSLISYLKNENSRHCSFLLSHYPGSDMLYAMDTDNKRLVPIGFYQTNATHLLRNNLLNNSTSEITDFATISLINTAKPVAAYKMHSIHHDSAAPKIGVPTVASVAEKNSYVYNLSWYGLFILSPIAIVALAVLKLRLNVAVAYSPVSTAQAAPAISTVVTSTLLNSVDATFVKKIVPDLVYIGFFDPPSNEASYSLKSYRGEDNANYYTDNTASILEKGCYFSFVLPLWHALYTKKITQRFITADFARKAKISQLQARQIQIKLKQLVDKCISGVVDKFVRSDNEEDTQNVTINLSQLASMLVKQLQSELIKKYLSGSKSTDTLMKKIESLLEKCLSLEDLKACLSELFIKKVSAEIKNVVFPGIPELAENHKRTMCQVIPIVTLTRNQLLNQLGLSKNISRFHMPVGVCNETGKTLFKPSVCTKNKAPHHVSARLLNFFDVVNDLKIVSDITNKLFFTN